MEEKETAKPRRGRPNRTEPMTLIQVGVPISEARGLRLLAQETGYASVQELLRELVRQRLREDRQP